MRKRSVRRLVGAAALTGSLLTLGAPAHAIEIPLLNRDANTSALSASNASAYPFNYTNTNITVVCGNSFQQAEVGDITLGDIAGTLTSLLGTTPTISDVSCNVVLPS